MREDSECLVLGMRLEEKLLVTENTCGESTRARWEQNREKKELNCALASEDGAWAWQNGRGGPCVDTHGAGDDADQIADGCVWEVTQDILINGKVSVTNVNRWVFTNQGTKCSAQFTQTQI